MRNIPAGLKQAFINGTRAVLIKVTTKTGSVFGYTDHDVDLVVDGVTYLATPALLRMNLTRSVNDTVSNQEFGSAWIDAPESDLLAGKFDNADLEVALCNWANTADGKFIVERGNLGVIQWTADGFRADMQSWMRNLQKTITLVTTAQCSHRLFNQPADNALGTHMGSCKLLENNYKCDAALNGTADIPGFIFNVTLSSGQGTILESLKSNWFGNGTLYFRMDPNPLLNNIPMSIKNSTFVSGNEWKLELYLPLPVTPTSTDVDILPGCDKTLETCKNKFNNVVNFGGFPHIKPEIAYR